MSNVISGILDGSKGRPMPVSMHLPEVDNPPVVILVHGFKGFMDWGHFPLVGETFAKAGFALLRFNFSHNGTTPGQPSDFVDLDAFAENNLIKELDDLQTVINSLKEQRLFRDSKLDLENIFLIGHSRGGGIALISGAEDSRIKGLATWASVNQYDRKGYPLDLWQEKGKIYIPNSRTGQQLPMNWQFVESLQANIGRLNIRTQCAKIVVPTLIIHGTKDPTVPYSEARELVDWNEKFELYTIPDADHSFGGRHPMIGASLSNHMMMVMQRTIEHFESILK
ncbi:MAG: pimeloyl-ACP methyl ester carboxylesterase [Granulosicoccus sp.]|jgi:pimeloyl-ACP methyl ester carboxylesterase